MTEQERATIYTVGHGHLSEEDLAVLLASARVNAVVDVRSQPYSRWAPQHNREAMKRSLASFGIDYRHLGELLGGRPADPALYPSGSIEGLPDYDVLRRTPAFRRGIDQVIRLARRNGIVVAVLCSEGDPHTCHRHLAIAPSLRAEGFRVVHLLPDGGREEALDLPRQMPLL